MASIFSVSMAYPVEKRSGTPMPRAADGHNGQAAAGAFCALFAVALAALPVIFAAVLTGADPAAVRLPVLVLAATTWGFVLAWGGVEGAARMAGQKLPELAQIAARSQL
jgi:hypothetical protein